LCQNPWINFQLDLMRCVWAVLPETILWGASFPLALASVVTSGREPGRIVGGVYAANTVGAIVGSLTFSMVLIPWLGTRGSQVVMIGGGCQHAAAAGSNDLGTGGRAASERGQEGTKARRCESSCPPAFSPSSFLSVSRR
jgi:hypothetical protein